MTREQEYLSRISKDFARVGALSLWTARKKEALAWIRGRNPTVTDKEARDMLACWLGKVYCNIADLTALWRLSFAIADCAALLPVLMVDGVIRTNLVDAANDRACKSLLTLDLELTHQWRVAVGHTI